MRTDTGFCLLTFVTGAVPEASQQERGTAEGLSSFINLHQRRKSTDWPGGSVRAVSPPVFAGSSAKMLTKCLTERGGRRLGTMCRFLRFRFVRACLLSVRGCVGLPRQAGPLSRQGTELVRAFSGHEVSAMPNDPADRQQTTRKVVAVSWWMREERFPIRPE